MNADGSESVREMLQRGAELGELIALINNAWDTTGVRLLRLGDGGWAVRLSAVDGHDSQVKCFDFMVDAFRYAWDAYEERRSSLTP